MLYKKLQNKISAKRCVQNHFTKIKSSQNKSCNKSSDFLDGVFIQLCNVNCLFIGKIFLKNQAGERN